MSSGVAVDDECKNVFEEIKKNKKHRYIVFYIKDEKSIAVETIGGRDASYDSFLTDLMKNGESECRYGLYDMEYEHQCQGATEVSKKQKLMLMSWCPDTAKIKKKMLYSSSFDALKKSLVGVHKYVQASGVKVSEEVKQKYDDIKKKKCHRYLVFYIKDEKTIAVEKIGKREDSYEDFMADIFACGPEDCRYGLFDFEYSHQCEGTTEKSKKEKLLLMSWCPDTAKIKKKMLYSSSFDALKKCLVGIQKYIQATDESEASRDEVEKQLRATDRQ